MKSADDTMGKVLPFGSSRRSELEFLPAAVEIIETPASPLGRVIAGTLIAFFLMALTWACLGHIDIIATAQGKVVPVGRIKVIQPLETGTVATIRVQDGDKVREGQVLIELDRTTSSAERNRIAHDLLRTRLDVARLVVLRAEMEPAAGSVTFTPPPEAPPYEIARTRAAMRAQSEQQTAKIASFDQQIAQKDAEAEQIATAIAKLEAGLPIVIETAQIREKVMRMEFGNRLAHLDAQLKLTDMRHDLKLQQRHAVEIAASPRALEWQREQTRAEYARAVMTDLVDAESKAAQLAEDLIKAEKRIQDQVLRASIDGTVQQLATHTIGGVVTPARAISTCGTEGQHCRN
jgi:hemolysin D